MVNYRCDFCDSIYDEKDIILFHVEPPIAHVCFICKKCWKKNKWQYEENKK